MVETKNGESYDGILVGADAYMNLKLKDVTVSSYNGKKFSKHPEVFIRGNNIKGIQLTPDLVENHIESLKKQSKQLEILRLYRG